MCTTPDSIKKVVGNYVCDTLASKYTLRHLSTFLLLRYVSIIYQKTHDLDGKNKNKSSRLGT